MPDANRVWTYRKIRTLTISDLGGQGILISLSNHEDSDEDFSEIIPAEQAKSMTKFILESLALEFRKPARIMTCKDNRAKPRIRTCK